MTPNEALSTQLDNLQWEGNCLDVENSQLRSLDEAVGHCVDLLGELEGAREKVTALGECIKALEVELIQSAKGAETAVQKAEAAETEVDQLQHVSRERDATYEHEMAELRAVLTADQNQINIIQEESLRECEAMLQGAELERYRALEEERSKWEEREQRSMQQLEVTKREYAKGNSVVISLGAADGTPDSPSLIGTQLEAIKGQVRSVTVDLDSSRERVAELKKENEAKELEIEKLKAERAMLRIRLHQVGAEEVTATSSDIGELPGMNEPCTSKPRYGTRVKSVPKMV